MKLKRIIASIVATALVGTTVAMTSALDASAVADTYTATLQGQLVNTGFWNGDASTVQVTGDGSYSVSLTYNGEDAEVTSDSCCLILTLDFNVYDVSSSGSLAETGIKIDINSVDCDGNSLNYSGSSSNEKAYRVDDDGSTIRHNIFNLWSGGQETEDISLPFSVTSGSVVTVNFTVSGLNDAITKAKELAGELPEETEAPTTEDSSNNNDTTSASDSGSGSGSDSTSATTTDKASDSDSDSDSDSNDDGEVAQEETANATSDAGVAGIVLVCALAGAGVVATRKRD